MRIATCYLLIANCLMLNANCQMLFAKCIILQTGNSFLLLDRTCRKHVQNVLIKKKTMKAIGPRRIPEPNRKILDSTQGFRGDSGRIPRDSVWVCRDSMGFRVGRNYEFSDFWGVRNFPYYNIRSENTRNSWVRVPVSGPFILCLQGSVSAPCIYCSRIFLQNPGVCACAPRF